MPARRNATPANTHDQRDTPNTKSKVPLWLRVVIPALLLVAWFAAVSIGGPVFGKLSEVVTNDQTRFLPSSSESLQVQETLGEFRGENEVPAVVIAASDSELTDIERERVTALAGDIAGLDHVDAVSPLIPSEDGKAVQVVALIDSAGGSENITAAVEGMRELIADADLGDALRVAVSGPGGFTADIAEAFSGIDGLLLLVAVIAVFIILVIVYRSPLLPLIVIFTSVSALSLSILIIFGLAKAEVLTLSGQTQGILFILVVGAATDYALLYTARYREALAQHPRRWDATLAAWRTSWEPILASGGTVIAGLICLLLSELSSNRQLGPVAGIGIAVSLLAGLTLLPALLLMFGRAAFWPVRPKFVAVDHDVTAQAKRGMWASISRFVGKHSRPVWIVTAVLLAGGAIGITQLQANGVPTSDFVVGESQARDGQALISEHFPGGSGSPTFVVASENSLEAVAEAAAGVDGVDGVAVTSDDAPGGALPIPTPENPAFANASPKVVSSQVLLQVTLAEAPDSLEAQDTIVALRDAVHAADESAMVGGPTAAALDTNVASERDRAVIIPIVLVVITLILMLLLRSIVAPLLLVVTTVLSFTTALGVSAWVFAAMGIPQMDPSVPLFAFVFLVALGVDYNIFLMTRVREEALKRGPRKGVLEGLRVTGGVITSAGVVLAATFAALGVIPVLFLLQLAIIVAFGVLLDTIVVRSLLVPALSLEIGRKVWWPSALSRQ